MASTSLNTDQPLHSAKSDVAKHLRVPKPSIYAVIRMDPVATIPELLRDPEAVAAAQAISPKKYLVLLCSPLDIPTPDKQWCQYHIEPVASVLRPEDPVNDITADMVMPIFSNTAHARGRPPVRPEPRFPFTNCFHWAENDMIVRVRAKDERYDDTNAVRLSAREYVELEERWDEEMTRSVNISKARARDSSRAEDANAGTTSAQNTGAEGSQRDAEVQRAEARGAVPPSSPRSDSEDSEDSESSIASDDIPWPDIDQPDPFAHSQSDPYSSNAAASFMEHRLVMNLFGVNLDPRTKFFPLVDAWFELEDHLTEDSIPSPVELKAEEKMIGSIIKDAYRRYTAAKSAQASMDGSPQTQEHLPGTEEL